jgi:hypothetical protein
MILNENQYYIHVDDINPKKVKVVIGHKSKTFSTFLPNKLDVYGFGKYNLSQKLCDLMKIRQYQIDYNEQSKSVSLIFTNLVFQPDNKIYNHNIIINLDEFVDYDGINMEQFLSNPNQINFEILKELSIKQFNHIGILEKKIKILEDEISSLKEKDYGYHTDY